MNRYTLAGFMLLAGGFMYMTFQVIGLRHEKRVDWNKDSRTYMLVQAAYNDGWKDCREGTLEE